MSTSTPLSGFVFTAGLAIFLIFGNSFPNALSLSSLENKGKSYYSSPVKLKDNTVIDRSNKVVMINFDDGLKGQLIYAKPILDKYGIKGSFFIICGRTGWMDPVPGKVDTITDQQRNYTTGAVYGRIPTVAG